MKENKNIVLYALYICSIYYLCVDILSHDNLTEYINRHHSPEYLENECF